MVIALLLGSAAFTGATTQPLPGNAHYRAVINSMAGPLTWLGLRENGVSFAFASKDGVNIFVYSNSVAISMPHLTGLPKGQESRDVALMVFVTQTLAGSAADRWFTNHAAKSAVGRIGSWELQTTFKASGRGSLILALVHT